MERTPNFGLYKPGTDDFINIDDLNANMDIIDTELKKASGGGNTASSAKLFVEATAGFSKKCDIRYQPDSEWAYTQMSERGTWATKTLSITVTDSCYLVAVAVHRDNATITVDGDGWTKIVETQRCADRAQWLTAYAKAVDRGTHSVTMRQASASWAGMKLLAIYNCSGFTTVLNEISSSSAYTAPTSTGKRRLYMFDKIYTSPSIYTNTSGLLGAEAGDFSVYYDKRRQQGIDPTMNNLDNDNSHAVTLDIEEG
ncbi:MAG: hypothetical protein IKP25_05190 [Ruminococcus sp.]|nr:hypothetical protein [Ruminococcus sp.]